MANDNVNGASVLDDDKAVQVAGIPEALGAVVKGVGELYNKIPRHLQPVAVGVGLPVGVTGTIVAGKIAISEATSDHGHLNEAQCRTIADHVRDNLAKHLKAWENSPQGFPERFHGQPSCENERKALENTYGAEAIQSSER